MAASAYFTATEAVRFATEANRLARDAHALLRAIDGIRAQIRSDVSRERADQLTNAWNATAESRNGVIRRWQTLTGRQWDTHGDNHTRP